MYRLCSQKLICHSVCLLYTSRAALCTDCFCAEATRLHNDANVLAMGGRVVGTGLALKIVDTFLDTPFSGDDRHKRRIAMIEG